jgi:hypothetical protein
MLHRSSVGFGLSAGDLAEEKAGVGLNPLGPAGFTSFSPVRVEISAKTLESGLDPTEGGNLNSSVGRRKG